MLNTHRLKRPTEKKIPMKLSFSFAKTVPPKRPIVIQNEEKEPDTRREVLEISTDAGVVVEKTAEDLEAERTQILVIPVKSFRTAHKEVGTKPEALPDGALANKETVPGLIGGDIVAHSPKAGLQSSEDHGKKQKTSVLMRIHEARQAHAASDAPDQEKRSYDADDFGWALMRGMGYDPSKDTSPDVTKDVLGNRTRRGLGVKPEDVELPIETMSSEE